MAQWRRGRDRYAEAILQAMRGTPAMPVFDPAGSLESAARDYMMVLFCLMLAFGIPVADVKELAVDIAATVTGRMRENLGHEAGQG
jgi:hypothetical protein